MTQSMEEQFTLTLLGNFEEPLTPTEPECEPTQLYTEEPWTPTEPECVPTELDSRSEEGDANDSLLQLAQNELVSQDAYNWPSLCEGSPEDSQAVCDNQKYEQVDITKPICTGLP
eukprot:7508387-Karenia_brevis.AAC.1